MGTRGEVFSSKASTAKRTYFFNVKENRLGDVFLNIVESKKSRMPQPRQEREGVAGRMPQPRQEREGAAAETPQGLEGRVENAAVPVQA
jgi:glycerol kinase